MYQSKITYPISELNSSFFLEELRKVLEIELLNQRNNFTKTFLPESVKKDDFLLNPITDSDLNPAFCAIVKAKSIDNKEGFNEIQVIDNTFLVKIAAYGLDNLRKIQDVIFQILNDLDVKHYFYQLKREILSGDIIQDVEYLVQGANLEFVTYNGNDYLDGETFIGVENITTYDKDTGNEIVVNPENNIIFDDGSYVVNSVLTELEVEKTANDRDLITGVVQLVVTIAENVKLNKTTPIEEIKTDFKLGENETNLTQQTNL
jgi:hypothetical protein